MLCRRAVGDAVAVGEHLEFYVPGMAQIFLDVDDVVAERRAEARDLGLGDDNLVATVGLTWRPWEKHEFGLSWYRDSADAELHLLAAVHRLLNGPA